MNGKVDISSEMVYTDSIINGVNQMKTRMWVVEKDQYGVTDRKFYIDNPAYVPRIGEFVDGDKVGGWVDHVQWNYPLLAGQSSTVTATVYVYLKENKK